LKKSPNLQLLLIVLFILISSQLSQAQFYFGQNKVQYTRFDWHVMETDHFRLFFYLEEEEIARMAARIAEDGYRELASKFKHEIYSKIPLIIYSSPNNFSQTNVIPQLLPESVGGFTEFLKGRVVVPFHGSYFDFRHVILHELVHVFTYSKLEAVMSKQRMMQSAYPPLWFIEGIAEFWSTEWDSEADMILKDMTRITKPIGLKNYPIAALFTIFYSNRNRFDRISGMGQLNRLLFGQSTIRDLREISFFHRIFPLVRNFLERFTDGQFNNIIKIRCFPPILKNKNQFIGTILIGYKFTYRLTQLIHQK